VKQKEIRGNGKRKKKEFTGINHLLVGVELLFEQIQDENCSFLSSA
jgi:hypothetical protein